MKILIWFLCLFANAFVTQLLSGIISGALPTMVLLGITICIAKALCQKWDDRKGHGEDNGPN